MTPNEFKEAQRLLDLKNWQAAKLLGCSLSSVTKYRAGDVPVPERSAKLLRLLLAIQDAAAFMRSKSVNAMMRGEQSRAGDWERMAKRLADAAHEATGLRP